MESFTKTEKKIYGGRGVKEHININFKSILENSNIMSLQCTSFKNSVF